MKNKIKKSQNLSKVVVGVTVIRETWKKRQNVRYLDFIGSSDYFEVVQFYQRYFSLSFKGLIPMGLCGTYVSGN